MPYNTLLNNNINQPTAPSNAVNDPISSGAYSLGRGIRDVGSNIAAYGEQVLAPNLAGILDVVSYPQRRAFNAARNIYSGITGGQPSEFESRPLTNFAVTQAQGAPEGLKWNFDFDTKGFFPSDWSTGGKNIYGLERVAPSQQPQMGGIRTPLLVNNYR